MERYIHSFEREGDRAKQFIGENTSELSAVRIFMTSRRDMIYAHSNFVKPECRWPTKIATNQQHPIEVLAVNLVATEDSAGEFQFMNKFWRALVDHFQFFVDDCVVQDARLRFLDFSGIAHVSIILSGDNLVDYHERSRELRPAAQATLPNAQRPSSPWIPGMFYLFVLIAVMLTVRFVTGPLGPWLLPVLIVGALLAVAVIGAFTLRNQQLLKEKNFIQLMVVSLQYLPLIRNLTRHHGRERKHLE